jgi:cytochrome c peroxidase
VHFYNTRDVLPRCAPNDPGAKVSCWPAPEFAENMNTRQLGNLGLSDEEENALVAFMKTLIPVCTENSDTDVMVMQSTEESI